MIPLCIDLYCGLGGWAEGFISEGYRVVGFDIERHDYGTGGYPGELVLRDVRSLTGADLGESASASAKTTAVHGLRSRTTPESGHGQNPVNGYKTTGMNWSDRSLRGQDFTRIAGRQNTQRIEDTGIKQRTGGKHGWFGPYSQGQGSRNYSSKSDARKRASALIAKIPFPLAQHIARVFKPIPTEIEVSA